MGKEKESSRSERDNHDKDRKDKRRSRSRSHERDDRRSERKKPLKVEIKNEDEGMEVQITKKKEPLSLEELLAKKKAEEEAKSKPVFISKEQRAQEAIKRRQEQVAAMRAASGSVPKFGDVPVTDILRKEKEQQRVFDRRDRERERDKYERERERYEDTLYFVQKLN